MCSSQTQPSQHLSHHLLSACCPCWGTVLSFTPPTDSFPSPEITIQGRPRSVLAPLSPFQLLPQHILPALFPAPIVLFCMFTTTSLTTLPSRREQAAHFKNPESPCTCLRACPSSILNRERKSTGTLGYMTASALGQLQGTG